MSAPRFYLSGHMGDQTAHYLPAPPEYSRKFVLSLAGSTSGIALSGVVRVAIPEPAPANHAADYTMVGSLAWTCGALGFLILREVRYGFNKLFPRVTINNITVVEAPEPPAPQANRRKKKTSPR